MTDCGRPGTTERTTDVIASLHAVLEPPRGEPFAAERPNPPRPMPVCGCGVYAVIARERTFQRAGWARAPIAYRDALGNGAELGRSLGARHRVDVVGPVAPSYGPDHTGS